MKKILFGICGLSLLLSSMFLVSCASTSKVDTDSSQLGFADSAALAPSASEKSASVTDADTDSSAAKGTVQNADKAAEAASAREAAIASGAELLGKPFYDTEALYADAEAGRGGDYADIAARYKAMENVMRALAAKKRIDENDLSSYSIKDYNDGEAALAELKEMAENDSATGAQYNEKAEAALASYTRVLNIAYRQLALDARFAAIEAKRSADSVMSAVAAADAYAVYVSVMTQGDASYSRQNTVDAYDYYSEARYGFSDLYEIVSEKRARALEAMEAARRRVAESAQYAREADVTSPITNENQAGIESPDTVLLEEEDYEDPTNAVIDIPDVIN